MPKPFLPLTLDEFARKLASFEFKRRITEVHMHHTWKPDHSIFQKRAATPVKVIESIYDFHKSAGWSDIAEHATIDPTGIIWTGRDWNVAPASATGHNGNETAGPFMFEMIGNFDVGADRFEGEQRRAAIHLTAMVLNRFGLPAEALRFHNQMGPKTCPGSSIKYEEIVKEVRAVQEELRAIAPAPTPAPLKAVRKAPARKPKKRQPV